jgi:hypothetical protein
MSELNVNRQVTISEVISLLDQGKSRKEIAEYYNIPMSVMAEKIFSHPKLKGLKAKKQYHINLIDDTDISVEDNITVENSDSLEMEVSVPMIETVAEIQIESEEVPVEQDVTENVQQTNTNTWE